MAYWLCLSRRRGSFVFKQGIDHLFSVGISHFLSQTVKASILIRGLKLSSFKLMNEGSNIATFSRKGIADDSKNEIVNQPNIWRQEIPTVRTFTTGQLFRVVGSIERLGVYTRKEFTSWPM